MARRGHPATEAELRVRHSKLAAGSTTPDEVWLNWVVRRRADDRAIGTVQATVTTTGGRCTGLIAWVIGVPWQGQGYASEAARMLVSWLCEHGADDIGTHINPGNHASMAVATRAGLYATDEDVDSELLWRARKQGNP